MLMMCLMIETLYNFKFNYLMFLAEAILHDICRDFTCCEHVFQLVLIEIPQDSIEIRNKRRF